MKLSVKYLQTNLPIISEETAEENTSKILTLYEEVQSILTGLDDVDEFNPEFCLRESQERLLCVPEIAEQVCEKVDRIQAAVSGVIRDLAYEVDAGVVNTDSPQYQAIREHAIKILGLADIVIKAIDSGFIVDVRIFRQTGE